MKIIYKAKQIVKSFLRTVPPCRASQYIMIDADSGDILLSKNPHTAVSPASTTKIMSCLLALRKFDDLEQSVVFPRVTNIGSLAGIGEGEQVRIMDLLYGMMLPSGNDAAEAVALLASGSITAFVSEMNQLAAELGCSASTHFSNPHGILDPTHTSTAYDMALITLAAMQDPQFRKIVATDIYTFNSDQKEYTFENTNALIHQKEGHYDRRYPYATGVKTGQISTGYSLISSASKDGMNLIQVYLNQDGDVGTVQGWQRRFYDSRMLFQYSFMNFNHLHKHPRIIK